MDESIFRSYDIVGLYGEQLDEDAAWKIGHATAQFLRSLLQGYERGQASAQSLAVGRDMRTHSPKLAQALIAGMTGSGANVIDVGMIDTPALYFAVNHFGACGGVQITAGHNRAAYNGFIICGRQARPVGAETGLQEIKHIATMLLHTEAAGNGTVLQEDITPAYKRHVLQFIDTNLKQIKMVIDGSNGMAGKSVPEIFGDLDSLEIIELNFQYNGTFKHDPNPLIGSNLAELKQTVVDSKADIGVCFDGDADSLIAVDEKGNVIRCDAITALLSEYFLKRSPHAAIVHDLRAGWAVQETIMNNGGTARRERVGHTYMKKAMKDSRAVFGGDLGGRFYYRDNYCADSGMITLTHLINVLSANDQPISELIRPFTTYANSGEICFNVDDKAGIIERLTEKYSDGEIDDLDGLTVQYGDWRFNCRPDKSEPLLRLIVEGRSTEIMEERLAEIKTLLDVRR